MARYIDAEHLTKKIELMIKECTDKKVGGLTVLFRVASEIMKCSSVDVEEVKHGEWTKITVDGKGYGQIYYQHSDCDVSSTELYQCPFKYCPRCGAKMDRGNNHE